LWLRVRPGSGLDQRADPHRGTRTVSLRDACSHDLRPSWLRCENAYGNQSNFMKVLDRETTFKRVPMTKTLMFATCCLSFLATGCLHPKIGPNSLPRERSLYSVSLADSWKEVTLLNIVKVRYLAPPVYVDIANIVSSYTLAQSATAGGIVEPGGTSSATLGGRLGSPTAQPSLIRR
jgi:hypothetical protein